MTRARKTRIEAIALGEKLRSKRKSMRITLLSTSKQTGVNIGHLSRFERGDFSFISPNLQKFASFLQVSLEEPSASPSLLERFAVAIKQSSRHEVAAAAMVLALESLR